MKILALETANVTCSVAWLEDNRVVGEVRDNMPSKQAERLFPLIDELLAKVGRNYAALDAVAVTVGPGSFTGIRIGLAAARGIALAADIPVIGITTLETVAWVAKRDTSYTPPMPIVVVQDARRQEVYMQIFHTQPVRKEEAMLLNYHDVIPKLPNVPFLLAGSAVGIVAPLLEKSHPHAKVAALDCMPNAAAVAEVAMRYYPLQGNAKPAVPFYLRKPDAKPQKLRLV